MSSHQPEGHQPRPDLGCLGWAGMVDQPCERATVALEIVTHAIQPFDLRRSDQPVQRQGCFTHAIAHQPLDGVVALTGGGELERGVRPHGFEHLVQRTRCD